MAANQLQPVRMQSNNPNQDGRPRYVGAMFINQKKTTESHPDYKGQVEIQGRKFWISGWVNTSSNGSQYQRLILEDFTDEDYRKSAEIEAAKQAANQQTQQQMQAGWHQNAPVQQQQHPQYPQATTPTNSQLQNSPQFGQSGNECFKDDDIPF